MMKKNIVLEIRAGTGGEEAALLSPICFGCIQSTLKTEVES
jgi:protein subunit release factor A